MGPTATHVGVQRPEGIGNGYTDGARSSVIVYRNNSGRLRTEVHTFDDEREISKKTNPAEGVSDAGSYYSFTGTRSDRIEYWISEAYEQDGSEAGSRSDYVTGSRNANNAAGGQNAVSGSDSNNRAGTGTDGAAANAAGANDQSETAGNQAAGIAGNASGGSQGGLNDDIKGSGADIDSDDESDSTSALAMGGKMLPVAAAATAGALFIIFLLLKRRKEDEEQ